MKIVPAMIMLWVLLLSVAFEALALPPISDSVSAHIQSLIHEGVHPRLRWSSFPDYQNQLETLYQQNARNPLWINADQPTPQARAVIAHMASADDRGLISADYDADQWVRWSNELTADPKDMASFDVGLSLSLMRYCSNLYLGRINPRRVDFGLNIEAKRVDLPNLVQKIAQSTQSTAMLDDLEPGFPLYERLKRSLVRFRQLQREMPDPQLDLPVKFSPGSSHKDVPDLRHMLYVLGDLPELEESTVDSRVYDRKLVEAVKSLQQRLGLSADGIIGNPTLSQLNVPVADRIAQIQMGMERLRWLPEFIRGPYLMVNIPSFQLFGSRNDAGNGLGHHDIQMNVIVGEAVDGRHTPVFHADMTSVMFRPYWNVPYKISAKELLPLARRNPGYLARSNLELVSGFAPNAPVYEPTPGNIEMLATGALKLRQKPGPKNALGLVKFTFPNNNNIYLHSTPSKGLFQRARRDFSHGCIRVQDPVRLAEFVLEEQGEWTRERIETAMNGGNPRNVSLRQGIGVYIFYSTVLANEQGQASFYSDIYGHDAVLQNLLAKGFPYPG